MRIGIDACCWSNRRGFGRFTRELVAQTVEDFPGHEFVLLCDRMTAAEASFPDRARVDVVPTRYQPTRAASADGSRPIEDLWRMSRATARHRFDAFFFPAVYTYYPLSRRVPTAITFHDAIAEQHPKLIFPGFKSRCLWNIKSWLARCQADRIVTVSENAREQIASAFNMRSTEISVITEGPSSVFQFLPDKTEEARIRKRFALPAELPLILYVGGISPHKNLHGLLQALAKMRDRSQSPWHAVLVGDYQNDSFFGCYNELRELSARLDLDRQITFTGFVSNEELVRLYNAATLVVLPSFSEGFGLPVVEAMACGVPVAASRAGSLPEVVGDAGLLFDPASHDEMATTLLRLLENSSLRAELRSAGLRRVERFTWKSSARKLMSLLEDAAHGARATA